MSPPPLPPNPYADYPASGAGPQREGLNAAIAVWISATLFLILATCCSAVIGMIGVVPMDQFRQSPGAEDVPAEAWDQIATIQPYAAVIAIVLALLTVVPALAMIILGFSVKSSKRGATIVTLILACLALLIMGLMFLITVINMVTSGAIDICSLSLFGGMTGCWVWCVLSLKKALSVTGQIVTDGINPGYGTNYGRSGDDDPWENSL